MQAGKAQRSIHTRKGFSLVEVLFAMTIGTFVLGLSVGTILYLSRGMAAMINYTDMNMSSRRALELFSRDIRMGTRVFSCSATSLVFEIPGKTGAMQGIEYRFDATARTFTRIAAGEPDRILLRDIQSLDMRYNTIRRNPTVNPIEIKEVQIEVVMEMYALDLTTTNHIISAQFMMRNKAVAM
jgi:prepilin-type N-terminal cleavage/methylation domain-containing protein